MSLRGWLNKYIDQLRGSWETSFQVEDQPARAFTSENLKFFQGRVTTRDGHVFTGITSTGIVPAMYNWVAAGINKLIYQDGTIVKLLDLPVRVVNTLFTVATGTRTFTVAEAGTALYFATFDNKVLGTDGVWISNTSLVGAPADLAFAPPGTIIPVISRLAAGQCSVGLHYFGYIITTRTGFTGKPGPADSGGVFHPVPFTVTTGMGPSQLNMAISGGTFPSDWSSVQVIMTRVDNPDAWFFVPGSIDGIPGGAVGFTVNIIVDFSDEDLADRGTDALPYFDILTQNLAGGTSAQRSPITPAIVCSYGARMVYVAGNTLYISDIANYQNITADLNTIQSPGQKTVTCVFPMRGVLYILGDNWSFSTVDNSDVPATWAAPQEVSGNLGTQSPYGVAWRTGGDYAWVAHESGLYLFNGQYAQIPISYRNATVWARINWNYGYKMQVKDYPLLHQVWVLVALDGNIEPSHILMWDYTNGMDYNSVDFSLYYLISTPTMSSIGLIKDPTANRSTMWIGPSEAGRILQQVAGVPGSPADATDDGSAIHSVWESGYVLTSAEKPAKVNRFWSYFLSVRGEGNLLITVNSKDRNRYINLTPIQLTGTYGFEPQRKGEMQSENISIRIETGAAPGEWFDLSDLNVYWKPWVTNR